MSSEVLADHGAIVLVDGDLDMETAPQLERHLADHIADGHRHRLDLTQATFLDSTALRVLITTITPLQDNADAVVVLAGTHGIVERVLAIRHWPCSGPFPTRREASLLDGIGRAPLMAGALVVRKQPVAAATAEAP